MSKKHACAWMDNPENRGCLHQYLSVLREGDPENLSRLPQHFIEQWKSAQKGAGVFHYVASHGFRPDTTVPFLLSRGMDPNEICLRGDAVLNHALNRSKEETLAWCQALLSHGARLDRMPCKGTSVLLAGVQFNRVELVDIAVSHGARRAYPETEAFLFRAGPEECKVLRSKPDALQPGAARMEMLLPASQQDIDRQWRLAIGKGLFDWVAHFTELGADMLQVDGKGENALHWLARLAGNQFCRPNDGLFAWLERVASVGVPLMARNDKGQTPQDIFELGDYRDDGQMLRCFLAALHDGLAQHMAASTPQATSNRPRPRL